MASKYATLLLSIFCFTCLAKESSAQQPRNVVVKGRVFCDTCGQRQLTDTNTRVIAGAVVAVECNMKRKLKTGSTSVEGKTGENGEFRVELSPSVDHSKCGVRLVSSPQQSCNMPSIATASHITLASNNNGVLTYNSPPLAFRPSSSSSCEHSDAESKQILAPPLLLQAPPLPFTPLPPTPPLPNLPFTPLPTTPPAPNLPFTPLPTTPPLPNLPFTPLPFSIPFPPLAFPAQPTAPPMK